jgi:hypothetical protein
MLSSRTAKIPPLLQSAWPALALAVVFLAANWPIVSGRECPPFDAFSGFSAYHHLVGAFARAGRWMTWNPWSGAGSPDYADPQFGAYSPFIVVTSFLANGGEVGFRVYWLLVWYLGGLGTIVLGRHLRVPRWGCFAVATTFCFCGFYTGHAEHTVTVYAFSGLPWMIWRADVAMQRGRLIDAAQAGALLGLSALGGYPGVVIANAAYTTVWTLGRAITARHRRGDTLARRVRPLWHWVVVMTIIAAVAGGVAATTYLPFFVDAAGFTSRNSPLPREVAVPNGALVPRALDTFASPAIAPLDFDLLPDISLRSVYLGSLVPVLALTAVWRRRRHHAWRWWIAGLGVVSLMCALATVFPLRGWLYDCCLPFRYFRQAALFRAYLLFSVTALALYGCRDLSPLVRRASRMVVARTVVMMTLLGATALAICAVVFPAHPELGREPMVHALVIWTLPLAILLLLALASALASRSARGRWRLNRAIVIGVIVTLAAVDGIWSAALSGPLLHATNDGWYRTSLVRYQDLDLTRHGLGRGIEDRDNINLWHQVPVLRNYTPFLSAWFERLARHPVFERAATQPERIFFASDAPIVAVHERVFAALLDRATTLNAPVLVAHTAADLIAPSAAAANDDALARDVARIAMLPAAAPIAVHLDRYLPDELTLSLTSPTAGWLLVTDRWARGWRATVNGAPATVYPADFVFRAVQVPAGRVQVRFTYEKSHGLWLVALSWSLCGLLLIVVPLARVARTRGPGEV